MAMYAHFTTMEIAKAIVSEGVIKSGWSSLWGFIIGYDHVPNDIPVDRLLESGPVACVVFDTDIEPAMVDEWSAMWSWADFEGELEISSASIIGEEEACELLGFDSIRRQ